MPAEESPLVPVAPDDTVDTILKKVRGTGARSIELLVAEGTAALSGFTQSVGYLLSAVGPFSIGLLHDATNGWTAPLLLLIALLVPLTVAGWTAIRSGPIEDQLHQR